MEEMKNFVAKDAFAKLCGVKLLEASKGRAKTELTVGEEHLNAAGVVQGGALFTLADLAFAAASNSHGTLALAINAHISFVKASKQGKLTAFARETSFSPKLATYSIDIRDESGDLVAGFNGMVYRKKEKIGT